jgi:hypothetical protein
MDPSHLSTWFSQEVKLDVSYTWKRGGSGSRDHILVILRVEQFSTSKWMLRSSRSDDSFWRWEPNSSW